jgi:Ran GTPase-activating protein (RanGAP) involved in mRNA processing and transport
MLFEQPYQDSTTISRQSAQIVDTQALYSITSLDLSHITLSASDLSQLGHYVKMNRNLQSLNCWGCSIGDNIGLLIPSLVECPSLFQLDLGGNGLDDQGCQPIASYLKSNKTLYSIELGCNLISDLGLGALVQSLCHNTTLSEFHIGDNPITIAGVQLLVSHLSHFGHLRISRLQEEYPRTIPQNLMKEIELFNYGSVQMEEYKTDWSRHFLRLCRAVLLLDICSDIKYAIASKWNPYRGRDSAVVMNILCRRDTLGLLVRARFSYTELIRVCFLLHKTL